MVRADTAYLTLVLQLKEGIMSCILRLYTVEVELSICLCYPETRFVSGSADTTPPRVTCLFLSIPPAVIGAPLCPLPADRRFYPRTDLISPPRYIHTTT